MEAQSEDCGFTVWKQVRILALGKKLKKRQKKFGKKTAEGIFIGYKVNSGLAFGEGYVVMDANKFKDTAVNLKCHIYCVKDIFAPDNCAFPVKEGTWKPKAPSLEDEPEGQILEDEGGITSEVAPEENESPSSDEDEDDEDVGDVIGSETPPGKDDSEGANYDRWERQGEHSARVHNVPRDVLCDPSEHNDPIPMGWTLENLDVQRTTITNGKEHADGKRNFDMDHWRGLKELDEKPFFKGWQGGTLLRFVKPPPPPGYY